MFESILLVEDEANARKGLTQFLQGLDYDVMTASNGKEALELFKKERPDLVISDIRMPEMDGAALLEAILAGAPSAKVILLTAYGSVEDAVKAMKSGAFYYLTKPVNLEELEFLVKKAFNSYQLEEENKELRQELFRERYDQGRLIAQSPKMKELLKTVDKVAVSNAAVLIEGESGTGKELIAQAIHQFSGRTGRFVPVHCAALPETLLESELFGHEKGAFTGANEQRKGRFELADGGTLFLDEIGEIPLATQVKLLRVLETRSFERIGGMETLQVDTRVVTATNRDLSAMVAEGTFREDLFYRLDVVSIHIPPLRERQEDIPPLVNHFLTYFANENGRPPMTISESAMSALCSYSWPGNIRELKNCVERMVVLTRGQAIELDNVPINIREKITPGITKTILGSSSCDLERNEKLLIARALEECKGNRTKAADKLGISRRTLHRKLATYGIE